MENVAKNEMNVHVGLCVHKNVKNIYIKNNDLFANEAKKHEDLQVISEQNQVCEVMIIKACELDEHLPFLQKYLSDDGILILSDLPKEFSSISKKLDFFNIIMPFSYGFSGYFEQGLSLFCSKKYHPTADLILQKADLLDGLEYYNCDIHIASFALPTSTKKTIREAIKI